MSQEEKKCVSVIGLGAMGAALATAFLAQGDAVTVWNRSPGKADALVAKGAHAAKDVREATLASPLVVVCVTDNAAVDAAYAGAEDALAGRVLVNLTNGTPDQARAKAAWAAAHDARYVDGGIMAIPPMVGTPSTLVVYSGSRPAFEAHRATLEQIGRSAFVSDDPGLAAIYDIAMLSGMYGLVSGALHANALVRAAGIEAKAFLPFLVPWVEGMMGMLTGMAANIDSGDHLTGVVSSLGMQEAGYVNLIEASAAAGVSTELVAPIHALMKRAVAAGHGAADTSRLALELTRT